MFKSGFVSIIGRPNAGKSTLLNSIINKKISIVTNKPQTTRNQIKGIYNKDNLQIVFIDTPGIHKPRHKLGEALNKSAFSSTKDVEAIVLIVDASKEIGKGDKFLIKELESMKGPKILLLNKIDLISKEKLIEKTLLWSKMYDFTEIIPISSLNNENLDKFLEVIKNYMPEGPKYYDTNTVSDSPERFIISEIIREKIIINTKEEIPHSVVVIIENMIKRKNNLYYIQADIIVDKDSKKAIIIGKGGSMLKKVGTMARKDIEELLNIRVMLELFVKVKKNWRNEYKLLKEFGYKEK